jgi:hypothetical protein
MNYNAAEITTTRISDLPMGGGGGVAASMNNPLNTIKIDRPPKLGEINTTYQNLNLHKNPYISEEIPFETTQNPLPSRDIPQNIQGYTIDPEIKANYIPPPPPKIEDYLRDSELITNKRIKNHQDKQKRKSQTMDIISDLQFSIYIAILFLLFNLPIMNVLLLALLGRFNGVFFYPDGNMNFYGIAIKSMLFAVTYYIIQKMVNYIVV